MPKAFLLQFQESCEAESVLNRSKIIQTATKVAREGSKDQACEGVYAIPSSQIATSTRQAREGADRNDANSGVLGLAISTASKATKTATFVNNESSDEDIDESNSSRIVPAWRLDGQAGTKTVTEIKAEASDADYSHLKTSHIIRPCS